MWARTAHNAGMRGKRRGILQPVEAPPACQDCTDPGVVYFAGELYCGHCALTRLIRALQAEVAEDEIGLASDDEALVEH
jgi:hypothetical protein